ncbi:bifunctional transcriptional activator/DNA repair enzyme AdaA [Leptolyngbya sp. KIOST-1]|uniref:bifunctional transcriptional activator/DNA repair enzyme AdaA n=1 Tax=Leptolyngbya sp. KIOST-1 TaxID=1229172 RepID=UPI00056B7892|nr:methylated-DNA--[protein]-cysteine S-methyltransferase [Leptolyngbya sp. KIOST-1]
MQMTLSFVPSQTEMETAFYRKDGSYDGLFFVAVRTTGIFCRPSCSSCPKRENVEFFLSLREAVLAGYRPCKRCRPEISLGQPPPWVSQLMERVEARSGQKLSSDDWQELGITPERARRWFQDHYGMTFVDWCRSRRLARAFAQIREGEPLDDVVFAHGYDSYSGFREAFAKTFGVPPGQAKTQRYIAVELIETPLGLVVAGAVDEGLCLLDYCDCRSLERHYATLRQRFDSAVLPVSHPHLDRLKTELGEYFAGERTTFTVPVALEGTPFQVTVWQELQRIPHGATIAYDELAQRIGQPTAMRAVARANGTNRISIVVPCHRVIGKDGSLTGYGGGLWRKRLLLELERTGQLPGN